MEGSSEGTPRGARPRPWALSCGPTSHSPCALYPVAPLPQALAGSTHPSVGSDLESFTKPLPSSHDILPPDAPTLLPLVLPPPDSMSPHRAVERHWEQPSRTARPVPSL